MNDAITPTMTPPDTVPDAPAPERARRTRSSRTVPPASDQPRRSTNSRSGTARSRGSQLAEFQRWLAGLGMMAVPSVHVNGAAHGQAVLVVDFGTPFHQPKLTQDQAGELAERMRQVTAQILARGQVEPATAGIRIGTDHHNGIWWSATS